MFRKTLGSLLVFGVRQKTWYLGIPTQSGESIPSIFGDPRPRGWCVFGCVSFHLEFQVNIFSDLGQKTILLIVVSSFYAFRASANALWCGDPPYVPPDGTRNHFISLGIPSDSMWNSKWKYLSGLRPKTILMIAVSDIYAFRTTSSDLWCGDRPCVPSEAISFHLEFQVILCDSKWNSKWRYLCKKVLSLYLFRIFRLSVQVRMLCGAETHQMCHSILLICISLGIPSDSMWNSKWTYFSGLRQKSVLMVVVLYLYGFWKSSSALSCGGHRICRDNFTWNFT